MTARRATLIVVALGFIALGEVVASAQTQQGFAGRVAAAWLPGDAPVIASASPLSFLGLVGELEAAARRVGSNRNPLVRTGSEELRRARRLLGAQMQAQLGGDFFTPAGLAQSGVDLSAGVLGAFYSIDETAALSAVALPLSRDALRQSSSVLWRHRIAFRVADRARFAALVSKLVPLLEREQIELVIDRSSGTARQVQPQGSRPDPEAVPALLAAMESRGALLGYLRDQRIVLLRVDPAPGHGEVGLLDVLEPMSATTAHVYRRALPMALAAPRQSLRDLLPAKGGLELVFRDSPLAARIDFERIPRFGQLRGLQQALQVLKAVSAKHKEQLWANAKSEAAQCLDWLAPGRSFSDAGVAFEVQSGGKRGKSALIWRLRTGLTPAGAGAFSAATSSQRQIDAAALNDLYAAVFQLRLDLGLLAGHSAQKGPFAGGLAAVARRVRNCGWPAYLSALAWLPQAAEVVRDQVSAKLAPLSLDLFPSDFLLVLFEPMTGSAPTARMGGVARLARLPSRDIEALINLAAGGAGVVQEKSRFGPLWRLPGAAPGYELRFKSASDGGAGSRISLAVSKQAMALAFGGGLEEKPGRPLTPPGRLVYLGMRADKWLAIPGVVAPATQPGAALGQAVAMEYLRWELDWRRAGDALEMTLSFSR